jgi:glutathione S-transferase
VKLYATPLSANGRKVLAAAHHLGLALDVQVVNVYAGEGRSAAYLAINPTGKIPTLVDGDFTLWESNAILQYLAEIHGRLTLPTAAGRADIARWMFWEASAWQPAMVAVLTDHVAARLRGLPPPPVEWDESHVLVLAAFLDAHLTARPFVCGELTIADFALAGMMTYARAAAFPFDDTPALAAWYRRIESLDAWRATAVAPWA